MYPTAHLPVASRDGCPQPLVHSGTLRDLRTESGLVDLQSRRFVLDRRVHRAEQLDVCKRCQPSRRRSWNGGDVAGRVSGSGVGDTGETRSSAASLAEVTRSSTRGRSAVRRRARRRGRSRPRSSGSFSSRSSTSGYQGVHADPLVRAGPARSSAVRWPIGLRRSSCTVAMSLDEPSGGSPQDCCFDLFERTARSSGPPTGGTEAFGAVQQPARLGQLPWSAPRARPCRAGGSPRLGLDRPMRSARPRRWASMTSVT
jgi:hypothetical protein